MEEAEVPGFTTGRNATIQISVGLRRASSPPWELSHPQMGTSP